MSRALPILMYHHISSAPGLVTQSPASFREQISALAHAGWTSIGTSELEAFLAGEPLPPKRLMLSFDDGYLDNYLHAHPVLQEFGMRAVLFVVTGWIGDGPVRAQGESPDHRECKRRIAAGEPDSVIVRWSEIEAMQAAGTFEFHSHTHSHTRWDRQLPDNQARLDALEADLLASRESLQRRLGLVDRHLCWPQGYYQEDYLPLAKRLGFDYLYTTRPGTNGPNQPGDTLRRLVSKEKSGNWLKRRLWLNATTARAACYGWLKGER